MFIKADELSKAISRVSTLASLDKNPPGILFNIQDNKIDIYYFFLNKAIINTVSASVAPEEIHGKVVFDYEKLVNVIGYCKSSGNIKVGNLELNLTTNPDGSGTAKMIVVKKVNRGETDEVIASNTYDLAWTPIEKVSIKQKSLSIMACEDMFNEVGADIWNIKEFTGTLSKAVNGNAKVVYLSQKFGGAFAVNDNSTVFIRTEAQVNKSIQFNSNEVKAINSILDSLGIETININTIINDAGKIFAYIFFTEDKTFSMYISAASSVQSHLNSIMHYVGTKYNTYNFNILTEVLVDTLKAVSNLNASLDGILTFKMDETGKIRATITAEDTNASVKNTYNIVCDGFNSLQQVNPGDNIISMKLNVKLLLDILNANRETYTAFDIYVNPVDNSNRLILRIGFIDDDLTTKAIIHFGAEHNIKLDSVTTLDDVAETTPQVQAVESPVEQAQNEGVNDTMTPGVVLDTPENIPDAQPIDNNSNEIIDDTEDKDGEDLYIKIIESMTTEDKLEIRDSYLNACYYTAVNKV